MSQIIVTGVPPDPNDPNSSEAAAAPRLEINTLIDNKKQFSLYIQALQRMYDTPQTEAASHFQIGGIHGLPFQPWEGSGAKQVAGSLFGGYCSHGTVLFPSTDPTWLSTSKTLKGRRPVYSSPSAAFDPIFYLHHTNVDRIFALWQAINPEVGVTQGPGGRGTFTLPASTFQNKETALTPFWNGATSFGGSNGSRDFTKLGYTYPEFDGLYLNDPTAVKAAIGTRVVKLYGDGIRRNFAFAAAAAPTVTASAAELVNETPATHAAPPAVMRLFALPARARAAQAPIPAPPAASAEATYTDWTARIHISRDAAGCSFSVLIFQGPVPEDPAQWRSSESYVGAQHVFTSGQTEQCENCRNTAEATIEGFVPLNKSIAARSGLNSYDPEVVEPYLKENLAWRILKVDRITCQVPEVPSLQVIVIATPMGFDEGEVFPRAGTGRHCHEITEGQPGGYHPH